MRLSIKQYRHEHVDAEEHGDYAEQEHRATLKC